jgi:hypothetical protein
MMYMNSNVRLHSQDPVRVKEKCNCRSRGGSFTRISPLPRFLFEGQGSTVLHRKKRLESDPKTLISLKKKNGIAIELSKGNENMSSKARKILALLNDPRHRSRLLDSLNKSTLDDVGPVGGDQSMAVLNDMNEVEVDHEEFLKSLLPRV